MTQEVAQRESTAIVPEGAGAAGLSGEFGQQDIVLPICSLSQPMSQDKGPEGHFFFADGTSLEEMDVVVLDVVATKGLWLPIDDESAGEGPLCRSADRVMGLTSNPERVLGKDAMRALDITDDGKPTYLICKDCRYHASATTFGRDEKGLWCPNGYTLLMYERNLKQQFIYFVRGSAVKPVKQRIVSPALIRFRQSGVAAPWANPFEWKPKEVTEGKKKWWAPEIAPLEAFGEVEADFYGDMSAELSGRAAQQSVEDPAPADADPQQAALGDD